MKVPDNGLETLIIKYTLGAMFIGITLVFVGKIVVLLVAVAHVKLLALKAYLLSGDLTKELVKSLKDAIFH